MIKGQELIIALARTPGMVELRGRGNTVELSPQEAIRLIGDSECFVGFGTKRNIKILQYQPPVRKPPKVIIQDSGFGLGAYPMPSQSSNGPRFPALARKYAGIGNRAA